MRFIILVSVLVMLTGFGCRGKIVEPIDSESLLSAEDVGVTDVWLKIHLPLLFQNFEITLKRDTVTILRSVLTAQDTLVLDERLLPNHTYTYTLIHDLGTNRKTQTQIAVTTMDTTSHNFTWEIYTLGDGSSSELLDVAIINDTLAYAVGEIYKKDSLDNWIQPPYNFAKWNGKEWEIERVLYNYQGYDYYAQLRAIFAFGESDYWVGSNQPMHWNGRQWETFDLTSSVWNGWINKIWGTSDKDLYIVGNGGSMTHYNGSRWVSLTTEITLHIQDIYGAINNKTGGWEILALASTLYSGNGARLIKINKQGSVTLPTDGLGPDLSGIWFKPPYRYYIVGDGIYRNSRVGDSKSPWIEYPLGEINNYYTFAIRGTDINDIVTVGAFGELLHFNGATWRNYYNTLGMASGSFYGVAIKGNLIIAVGHIEDKAVIAVGRR
jgi:hypothetical protein